MLRRALLAVLGVAVLAALVFLVGQGPGERGGALAPETGAPDAQHGPADLTAAQAGHDTEASAPGRWEVAGEQPETVAPPSASGAVPSFRGRLLLPDGKPAGAAGLKAFGMVGFALYVDPADPATRPLVEWETRTDADGRFEFPEVARDGLRFVIRARAGELPPLERTNLPAQPGRTRELGDLQLTEGFDVEGLVSDPDGHPVYGAVVVPVPEGDSASFSSSQRDRVPPIPDYSASSDAQGRFQLRNLPAGRVRLRANASGYAPGYSAPVAGAPKAEVNDLTLVLPRARALEGVVLNSGRTPIAGARLQLTTGDGERMETTSDRQGRFRLDPPEDADRLNLNVVAAGCWPKRMRVDDSQRAAPLEVVLAALPPLQGYVEDGNGHPVAGATVALLESRRTRDDFSDPALLPRVCETTSGAEGAFSLALDLTGTQERRFQAVAWAGGQAPAFSPVLSIDERDNLYPLAQPLRLVLGPGLEARGSVLDGAGAPVAGARVQLRRLSVQRGGAGRRGLAPETRRPGSIYQSVTTGADGAFDFSGMPVGDYRLEAYAAGHSPAESPDFPLVGPPYETVLTLPAASGIEGDVQGDLAGLGQLRVTASSPRTDPVDTLVDAHGHFRFEDLLPETYEVVLREVDAGLQGGGMFSLGSGEGLARASNVVVASGATAYVPLELNLAERASLSGRVRINGQAVSNLNVFLVPRDIGRGNEDPRLLWRAISNRLRTANTDYRGEYRLAALDAGDYWLVVERGDTWPQNVFQFDPGDAGPGAGPTGIARLDLSLAPGQHAQQDVDLMLGQLSGVAVRIEENGETHSVRGGVAVLQPGEALAGVAERRVNLGRDGSFNAEMLAAGSWSLSVESGDYAVTSQVQVPPGDTAQVELSLEKSQDPKPRPVQ